MITKIKIFLYALILCIIAMILSCKTTANSKIAANPLVGTSWVLHQNENIKMIKVFSDKVFVVYVVSNNGTVLTQHSGTYEVNGDELTEKILHAAPDRYSFIGNDAALTITLTDNKMKAVGKVNSPDFAPFVEEWTKVETESQLTDLNSYKPDSKTI